MNERDSRKYLLACLRCAIVCVLLTGAPALAARHVYDFTFNHPMSWADDASPWANYQVQEWEIADGGKPGKALRINGKTYGRTRTYEIRTLQFNHKPGTPATVWFDIRGACVPAGSSVVVRHFDGYCGALPFHRSADDLLHPFPEPLWDSRLNGLANEWQRVRVTLPVLQNSVLTLAIIVKQEAGDEESASPEFIDVYIDNLKIEVTLADELRDPEFDWHGVYGSSTEEFRWNTIAANADWCDYADQEIVRTENGIIRYTLFQFRDASMQPMPGVRHSVIHDKHSLTVGGFGTICLRRSHGAGNLSAVSWGVRQTVSYTALGLGPNEKARIKVTMKVSASGNQDIGRLQIGVCPYGNVITRKALWTPDQYISVYSEPLGWITPSLEFERPAGARGFTIFFRHQDGLTLEARDRSYPPPPCELQSQGTTGPGVDAYADWVKVEVVE